MALLTARGTVSVGTARRFGASARATTFVHAVYTWMAGGLALTATTAWFVAASPTFVAAIATNTLLFWGLAIAQIGIVMTLSTRVDRLASSTAGGLFVAYSALTGVTLSVVLLAYTGESVASTFLVAAGMLHGRRHGTDSDCLHACGPHGNVLSRDYQGGRNASAGPGTLARVWDGPATSLTSLRV